MTTDDLLKQGIAALKAGRKTEARNLLMQVVEQDERNEMAWLWLSGAVDTDEERRICLENVLATNPNNGVARRGLEQLVAKEGVRNVPTRKILPSQHLNSASAEIAEAMARQRSEQPDRPRAERQTRRVSATLSRQKLPTWCLALGIVVTCLMGIVVAGGWYAVSNELIAMPGTVPASDLSASTPTPPLPSLEEVIERTLGKGYIFEQRYLGSPEGPNVLVIEARADMNDQVSPLDHIPFFVEVFHARSDVSGIKLVVWGDWPYPYLVRSSDIQLYERREIGDLDSVLRWAE